MTKLIEFPTEEQPPPTVSFERSYVFNVENRYTGPVGQVRATADSGEDIASYSLYVDDGKYLYY